MKLKLVTMTILLTLTLLTFAGRKRFSTGDLYAQVTATSYVELTSIGTLYGFTTTQPHLGIQSLITNTGGTSYGLYEYNGTSYVRVYSTGW